MSTHGHNPKPLNLDGPPPVRWTAALKEDAVLMVQRGETTPMDLQRRFGVSAPEFESWRRRFKTHGRSGLKVTKLQEVA